jgi:hypothetical protein
MAGLSDALDPWTSSLTGRGPPQPAPPPGMGPWLPDAATGTCVPVESRIGLDGKTRKMPRSLGLFDDCPLVGLRCPGLPLLTGDRKRGVFLHFDKALAFEAYAKQAKNTEAERRACEIRLRAERKAGQLLAAMSLKPGRPAKSSTATRISDLQISEDQSSKWQQLAAVPDEQFEAALAAPEKPGTSATTSLSR